jgi:type IV secretory pathway TrbD component
LSIPKFATTQKRHCERSAAIHDFGAQQWIATAYGLAMTGHDAIFGDGESSHELRNHP